MTISTPKKKNIKSFIVLGALLLGIGGCAAAIAAGGSSSANRGNLLKDAQAVDTDVIAVQLAVASGDVNQIADAAYQAHSQLSDLKDQIASDVPNNDAGTELYTAVNDLKNSMAAAGDYTGNPNPETLASFKEQYQNGVSEWNDAVGKLFVDQSSPPTIPTN